MDFIQEGDFFLAYWDQITVWQNNKKLFSKDFEISSYAFALVPEELRWHLITKGQLIDIARQETNTSTSLEIEFEKAIKNGSYIFKQPSWYGNLLYLGEHMDFPIFTITNEQDSQSSTKPSNAYLKTIIDGLRESHFLDNLSIFDYLQTKHGIIENYSEEELRSIIGEMQD